MSADWIDKLEETYVASSADNHIAAQKHELLLGEVIRVKPLLEKCIVVDVEKFNGKFPGRIEGPINTLDGGWKIRTTRFPLHVVELVIGPRYIQFSRMEQRTQDASLSNTPGSILVKVEFGKEPWFEHKGKPILTVAEVSEFILSEVFKGALQE